MEQPLQIGSNAPMGYGVVAIAPFPHPHDAHLYLVLAQRNDEFAVWDYNAQTNGFANGQYPQNDRAGSSHRRAFVIFAERLAKRVQSAFLLDEHFKPWYEESRTQ